MREILWLPLQSSAEMCVLVAGFVVAGVYSEVRRRVPRNWKEAARDHQQCRTGAQLQGRQTTVYHWRIWADHRHQPFRFAAVDRLHCSLFIYFGSRALSCSDHYCQSTCRDSVILSVRSFFKMHFLRQFLSDLDKILTQCSTVRIVDPGLMTSLQRANLIAYRLVSFVSV